MSWGGHMSRGGRHTVLRWPWASARPAPTPRACHTLCPISAAPETLGTWDPALPCGGLISQCSRLRWWGGTQHGSCSLFPAHWCSACPQRHALQEQRALLPSRGRRCQPLGPRPRRRWASPACRGLEHGHDAPACSDLTLRLAPQGDRPAPTGRCHSGSAACVGPAPSRHPGAASLAACPLFQGGEFISRFRFHDFLAQTHST